MAQRTIERRLAAIVIADVVGYSKLIGTDEAGTLARFRDLQETLIEPTVETHGGHDIKTNVLAGYKAIAGNEGCVRELWPFLR